MRFEIYKNNSGKISVEGRISYIGLLKRQGDPTRIILDITNDELLLTQTPQRTALTKQGEKIIQWDIRHEHLIKKTNFIYRFIFFD